MKTVLDVRCQLRELCRKLDISLESCGQDTSKVRQCLSAGFFLNAAELQLNGSYKCLGHKIFSNIHPSSSLFKCKPSYVIFTELVQTSKCYMKNVSVVDPLWLIAAAPHYFRKLSFDGKQFHSVIS